MVSCREPSPLKGSKHSLQHHPHDAAPVNAHSFVSMGVKAKCRPHKSAAHCWHMKRQHSLCHCCPCRDPCHCDCHCHLHRCHHLRCCCRCRRHRPLPLPLPSAIAVAVAINRCRRCLYHVAVSHPCCRCPCRRPLPSLSPSAIAVAISVGHHVAVADGYCQELLPWHGENSIQTI